MNKTELVNCVKVKTGKARFVIKKYSPEIFIVAGIVGTVVSTVMACKATTKAGAILDDAKTDLEKVRKLRDDPDQTEYSPDDAKHDLTIVYAKTGFKMAKLYAPAATLGALSVASILTSHDIMRKRNMALAAAYATVDKSFKDYRGRVVERFGEEVDKELKYNMKTEQIEETETDENGKEKKVKKKVGVADIRGYSEYARFFDESSRNWDKNAEYNLQYLKMMENLANDKLHAHGHLFLNEVYDMLDIPRSKAGQVVGWVHSKEKPAYVDFGIFETYKKNRDFVNGYERCILLDFNVTGNILDDFDPCYDC